ncbi:hypothetical protein FRB96_004028 [Tulasnella sp. 330]|nr:hypothetical protein FRB96_004028 [Tulasnella sp. 330]
MPPVRRQREPIVDECKKIVRGDSPRPKATKPPPVTPSTPRITEASAAPIHRLPVELTIRIFSLMVNSSHNGSYHEQLGQLRLTAHAWDDIIRSSPTFWSVIDCRFSDVVLATSLTLSKDHWLDVDVRPPHKDTLSSLLKSLHAHAHRIRSIRIVASMLQQPLVAMLIELSKPFMMEYGVEDYNPRDGWKMLDVLSPYSMPRLRHLSLGNIGIPSKNNEALLSGLRTLVLHTACSLPEVLRPLHSCSRLVALEMHGEHYEPVEGETPESLRAREYERVSLPHLHTLRLSKLHLTDVHWILRHLDIPSWACISVSCRVEKCDDVLEYARSLLDQFIQRLGPIIRFCPSDSAATVTIGLEQLSCEIAGRRMRIIIRGLATHLKWAEAWRTIVRRLMFETGLSTRPVYLSFFREFSCADIRIAVTDWSLSVTEVHIGSAQAGASRGGKQAQAMLVALGRTENYAMLESGPGGKVAWTFPNVHSVVFDRCPVDGAMLLKIVKARSKAFVAAAHTVNPSPITSLHFFEVTGLLPEALSEIKAIVPQVVVMEPRLSSFGTAELGRSFSLDSIGSV